MSITSEIERIKTNIANAYAACEGKGATMPAILNSANLAECISSITGGTPVDTYDYVDDGLIMLFSGEDEMTLGTWRDRIGGFKFVSTGNAPTYDAENKLYHQTGAGSMLGDFVMPAHANYSFEVTIRDILGIYNPASSSSGAYCAIVGSNMTGYEIKASGTFIGKNTSNVFCGIFEISRIDMPHSKFTSGELSTFTFVPTVGIFLNGAKILDCGTPTIARNISLFGHYDGSYRSNSYSTGKIHSVRMYNRQLTAEEVMQNYEEDVRIYGE